MSINEESVKHALAILETAEAWDWPETILSIPPGKTSAGFKAIIAKFLRCFILESASLGGSLLDRFWHVLGLCDPLLKGNVSQLQETKFINNEHTVQLLFQGLNREGVDFDKICELAIEIFTHLGVAMSNPGGNKSNFRTPITVSEEMNLDLDELLRRAGEPGIGTRKPNALKELAYKRDGGQCLLTDMVFTRPPVIKRSHGVAVQTTHIIPALIHDKPDTLAVLAMFAGPGAVEVVLSKLNTIGNVTNLELNANAAYEDLCWGIEAREENGQIKYIYRNVPSTDPSPPPIKRRDGDRINFGAKDKLPGPDPTLCNIHLAVARALKMSGAVGLLEQLNDEADDSDFPHNFVASDGFADILTAKLLLSGSSLLF